MDLQGDLDLKLKALKSLFHLHLFLSHYFLLSLPPSFSLLALPLSCLPPPCFHSWLILFHFSPSLKLLPSPFPPHSIPPNPIQHGLSQSI
ncbi:hypothetical protein FKM82_029226 [Ascaphus truei]